MSVMTMSLVTALHMSYTVSSATLAAVRASISTPVLAVTSTRGAIKRLGSRWTQLHRLAYLAGVAACVHFLWLVKADPLEPALYATVLGVLLLLRFRRPAPQ